MRNNMRWQYFLALSLGVMFLGMGCEDRPDTENVDGFFDGRDISADTSVRPRFPERADPLEPGQDSLVIGPAGEIKIDSDGSIVEITLSGAVGSVSWNVVEGSRGEIVRSSNTGAMYRRTAAGDNVVEATDGAGRSVAKVIKQPAPELEALVLEPAASQGIDGDGLITELTLLANGDIVELRLSGAVGAVTWSVSTGTGTLVTQSNTGASYQRTSAGDNVVTAKDAMGREAYKVIKQP